MQHRKNAQQFYLDAFGIFMNNQIVLHSSIELFQTIGLIDNFLALVLAIK